MVSAVVGSGFGLTARRPRAVCQVVPLRSSQRTAPGVRPAAMEVLVVATMAARRSSWKASEGASARAGGRRDARRRAVIWRIMGGGKRDDFLVGYRQGGVGISGGEGLIAEFEQLWACKGRVIRYQPAPELWLRKVGSPATHVKHAPSRNTLSSA